MIKELLASGRERTEEGVVQWRAVRVLDEDCPACYGPREGDDGLNGKMWTVHGRYSLGDMQFKSGEELMTAIVDEALEQIQGSSRGRWFYDETIDEEYILTEVSEADEATPFEEDTGCRKVMTVAEFLNEHVVMLPLYLYDHGGITMSTGPFSCPWDSGQVGHIWNTKKHFMKTSYYPNELFDPADSVAEALLKDEVDTYDQWLRGEVFGVVIEQALPGEEQWDEVDSCWGFIGAEQAAEEGEEMLRAYCENVETYGTCCLEEVDIYVENVEPRIINHEKEMAASRVLTEVCGLV